MIILVTGGTRGIGAAMVKALKKEGHIVAVTARVQTDIECDMFIQADLSKKYDRHGIVRTVVDGLGGLDVLINNAGAQHHMPFIKYFSSDWNKQMELMLTAPFDLSQQAAKYMLNHEGGHIINILSTSAFQGARNIAGYVAAKHGLLGLTRSMSVELAPKIHVNAIAPGLTETDMTVEYIAPDRKKLLEGLIPAGRFGKPSEMADALLWLIKTDYVYGQTIVIDGGWLTKTA